MSLTRTDGLSEDWKVLPGLDDAAAPDLASFLAYRWPLIGFSERRRLVQALAERIAAMHRAGRSLPRPASMLRIHRGAQGWRVLPAGPDRKLSRCRRDGARKDELARLCAELLPQPGRSWCLRFLSSYLGGPEKDDRRLWFFHIEKRALLLARRRWRRQARLALGDGAEFVREKAGAFQVLRRGDAVAQNALTALLPDPDRLLAQGEVLFGRGNSCIAARVDIAGQPYLLKRYDCRGVWNRFRHLFRRSRALRNWLAARAFQLRGVPLPQTCLCLEERRWRMLIRSYTLTEFFDGSARLSDLYPEATEAWRRGILVRLATVLGRLHRFGGIHGDTNWDNILVRREGEGISVALVDLDGSRILARPRPPRTAKDIWHFVRDMQRRGGDRPEEISFFLRCWRRWSGWRGVIPGYKER